MATSGTQLIEKSLWAEPDVIADMERALGGVAPAMEIDVRVSADGAFFVSHDATTPSGKTIGASVESQLVDAVRLRLALDVLAANPGKHLVVELKSLGDTAAQSDNAMRFKEAVAAARVAERITVSSLSPSILLAVHRVWPEVPLILNAGIVPVLSYPSGWFGRWLANRLHASRGGYLRLGLRGRYAVLATGEGALEYPHVKGADGSAGDVMYALTELPPQLLSVLQDQASRGVPFGGAVSVATVTAYCNGLRRLPFLKGYASRISRQAIAAVHAQGVNVQTTTWGAINSKATVADWQPAAQLTRLFAVGIGPCDMVYTRGIDAALLAVGKGE
ncbi:MAG: hypothetical protein LBH11_03955 [Propionibacteriaceae bacterium]|jgi:hypothetical protein|nr:hypothetical protein [Propionibacteriaceae bacterium]